MKSTIRKNTYGAIYRLLDRVSPLPFDCGTLCGGICCSCDKEHDDTTDYDMGIYLLPGEEKLFTGEEDWLKWTVERAEDYEFPDSWHGKVYFVRCKTPPHCLRQKRPLQCRFFPLAPYLDEKYELHLILSPAKLPYVCPLVEKEMKLDNRFIHATYTVWSHLIRDPLIRDLVEMDSQDLRFMGSKVKYVFFSK